MNTQNDQKRLSSIQKIYELYLHIFKPIEKIASKQIIFIIKDFIALNDHPAIYDNFCTYLKSNQTETDGILKDLMILLIRQFQVKLGPNPIKISNFNKICHPSKLSKIFLQKNHYFICSKYALFSIWHDVTNNHNNTDYKHWLPQKTENILIYKSSSVSIEHISVTDAIEPFISALSSGANLYESLTYLSDHQQYNYNDLRSLIYRMRLTNGWQYAKDK